MKLSMGVRYALRMMVDIAKESEGTKRVSLNQVSQTTLMPRPYLEQLAIPLRRAELLKGTTGRGGGYVLARPAGDIRISQIVESVLGPMGITKCAVDPDSCSLAENCECRVLYARVNDRITGLLEELSLADLVEESWLESARPAPKRTRKSRRT